jgi:hypothetical protein
VLCQRAESRIRWKGAGWLHGSRLRGAGPRCIEIDPATDHTHWTILADKFRSEFRNLPNVGANLARDLGVTLRSLDALGVGWDTNATTWPMRDHLGRVIGIRRRCINFKHAMLGSRNGLFIPSADEQLLVLVTEGETDLAAALSLGFFGIGRPGCSGGAPTLCRWLTRRTGRDLVIVADADVPGIRGGNDLAQALAPYANSVRVILPPRGAKDLRASLLMGATHADLFAEIEAAPRIEAELSRRTK